MMKSGNGRGATMSNLGAEQKPRPVTRYTAVRSQQERRMGAGSLLGGMGSVQELAKQMRRAGSGVMTSDFSRAAAVHAAQYKHQQLDANNDARNDAPLAALDPALRQLEADIVMQETQLRLERARADALRRRTDNAREISEMQRGNAEMGKALGDATAVVAGAGGRVPVDPRTTTGGGGGALTTAGRGGIPAALPRAIKYEKLVLCFAVWFKEPWYEEAGAGFDVRTFMLRYYMADQSLEVIEPAVLNSGKPSGAFLKRTVLRRPDGNPFEPADFAVGKRFQLSGRAFTVCDADQATRAYFDAYIPEAAPLVQRLAVPVAPQRTAFAPGMRREPAPHEPTWKGQSRAQRTNPGRFLDDDGKVLTFVGIWDDTGRPGGDVRRLKIRFYVADHTMEVGEMLNGNSGRDLTSRFRVVRQRLKKPVNISKSVSNGVNFGQPRDMDVYFEPRDLVVGTVVPVFGRPILVHSCDGFTRGYFRDALGVEQPRNMNPQMLVAGGGAGNTPAPANAQKKKARGPVQQTFGFLEPQDKVARLETAIREKLEVASNFGTLADQRRHLQAMFHVFDSDHSGRVSQAEFKEAMQGFSMFGADVDSLFLKYDKDGNGSLSIAEFAGMLYNNPSAMRFSMDSGRDSREALKAPPSPKRQAMGEAPPTDVMAAQVARNCQSQQMLTVLEQNLRDKAESLSNFSSSEQVQQRKLLGMFKRFDMNGNGTLSRSEFRAAVSLLCVFGSRFFCFVIFNF
jgi:Ca2+-binding EF-hand superfamily protein